MAKIILHMPKMYCITYFNTTPPLRGFVEIYASSREQALEKARRKFVQQGIIAHNFKVYE